MEARRLIRDADHSPEKLAILSDAFDQAWSELEVCWMENIWGMAAERGEADVHWSRASRPLLTQSRHSPRWPVAARGGPNLGLVMVKVFRKF
jgi:hypothetical protein